MTAATVTPDSAVVKDLALRLSDAIQVLSLEDVLDGSGHLSARVPGTETFVINPRYAAVLADPPTSASWTSAAVASPARGLSPRRPRSTPPSIARGPTWGACSTATRATAFCSACRTAA